MKKIFLLLGLLISFVAENKAQFITSGTIEFTKTVNLHLSMKLEYAEEFGNKLDMDNFLKMIPKNATTLYVMTFDQDRSMYRFDKPGPEKIPAFGGRDPASENIVYKNFKENTYKAEKEVFGTLFSVSDSIPDFQWKIHDEIRQIAGYNCRKATTVINDSVIVIAFYSDEIMVSSGPESFGGLPGMILGLAVPRLYSSWFATKVELVEYDPGLEKPISEKKVKKVNRAELLEALEPSLSDWGRFGTQVLYKANL